MKPQRSVPPHPPMENKNGITILMISDLESNNLWILWPLGVGMQLYHQTRLGGSMCDMIWPRA